MSKVLRSLTALKIVPGLFNYIWACDTSVSVNHTQLWLTHSLHEAYFGCDPSTQGLSPSHVCKVSDGHCSPGGGGGGDNSGRLTPRG